MGWTQLERLQSEFGSNLTIVLKPFLLGALFREIGTAMLPTAIGADSNKSRYVAMDTKNTVQFLNGINKSLNVESVDTYWNDAFPLRTVTSLRIAILEPNVIPIICELIYYLEALADLLDQIELLGSTTRILLMIRYS